MRFEAVNLGESAQDLSLTAMVDIQCTEAGVLPSVVLPRSATGAQCMSVDRSTGSPRQISISSTASPQTDDMKERTRTRIHPSIIGPPPSRLAISPWKHPAMRDTTRVQSGKEWRKIVRTDRRKRGHLLAACCLEEKRVPRIQ